MIDWRRAICVFGVSFALASFFINSDNAKYFLLQNAMIANLADNASFALRDQAIPGFNLVEGDETFRFRGNVYPMKQPGQTVVGTAIYSLLQKIGIDFHHHYDYASNIITMLTSAVAVGLTSVILYLVSQSVLTPIIFALATVVWPYAGVSHHDIYALPFLTLGWYLASRKKYFFGMFILCLSLFFSMLHVTFVISIGLFILLNKAKFQNIKEAIVGLVTGLIPSFVFNYYLFGNIFLFPNLAGQVKDTVPIYDLTNFVSHIGFFLLSPLTSIFAFSPILLIGVWSVVRFWNKSNRMSKLGVLLTIVFLLHIFTQETVGGYQYGPRYLLPLMPIWAYITAEAFEAIKNGYMRIIFFIVLAYSIVISMIGAMTNVMYPIPNDQFAPQQMLREILGGNMPEYRIMPISILLLVLTFLYCRLKHVNPVRSTNSEISSVLPRKRGKSTNH